MIQASKESSKNCAMVFAPQEEERTQQRGRREKGRPSTWAGQFTEAGRIVSGRIGPALRGRASHDQSARAGCQWVL
jgi:hypothetical protein